MALIFEDSQKVTKKQIPIPQNAKKAFKALKKVYKPYLDKNIPGSKILKSLGSEEKYNKKGVNSKTNGKPIKQDSVNVDVAKVRLHRMNKLPKNSLQYQLNGGELAANIYRDGIARARSQEKVSPVDPPKPTSNAEVKPADVKQEKISTPNGKITYSVTAESRKINESWDEENPYIEYLDEYGPEYVFNQFLENPKGKQNWGRLINPEMYAKALRELSRFGKLTNSTFPSKYIYQWMGIIMRNTAILKANTSIAGHSRYFPYDEFEDFLHSYYGDNREIKLDYHSTHIKIEIPPTEIVSMLSENVVDKYGQTYFPWMDQDEVDNMVNRQDFKRKYGDLEKYVEEYNEKSKNCSWYEYIGKMSIDYNTSKIYWDVNVLDLLFKIGVTDEWMTMPDGSEGFSDYGIEPLEEIFEEYNEDLPPEKVLVLVNRALDVYHQRGDMASIFVQGGSKALSRIAEEVNKSKKKIYISEKTLLKLKNNVLWVR